MTRVDRDLTIAYSSLAARVPAIRPPRVDGVEVIACVQGLDGTRLERIPEGVDRVVSVAGRGVARSRNAAIDAASRRYLLFCDDDVEVQVDDVLAAVAYLRRTGAAIALGRGMDTQGRLRKRYASNRPVPVTLRNSAKAATYEMLVDVEQVRAAGVRFDERFGAGVETYLGDEYLFIADLLRAGLTGDNLPFVYGVHPESSSGSRWGGRDLHVRAVVLNHVFGRLAPAARFAFAVRRREEIGSLPALVRFVADGATLEDEAAHAEARHIRTSRQSELAPADRVPTSRLPRRRPSRPPHGFRQSGPVRRDSVA